MLILFFHIGLYGAINIYLFAKVGKLYSRTQDKFWIQILLGYAIASVIFNIWVKTIGYQGVSTIVGTYFFGFLFGALLNAKKIKSNYRIVRKPILVIIALMFVFSIFQSDSNFVNSKIGYNYWHSANADVFDGLCGAKSIIANRSSTFEQKTNLGTNETRINSVDLLPYLKIDARSLCSNEESNYLSAKESMQYTNIALLSELLQLPPSMYIFLFQSILNLILFFNMLVIFGRRFFSFSRLHSRIFASFSVLSHLYFVTFINGHIGSMMIQAPLVLLCTLMPRDRKESKENFVILTILSLFIMLSYPYIIPFILIFSLIQILSASLKIKSNYHRIIPSFIILLFTISCWFAFSAQRDKVKWAERSWGTFLNPLGPLQYIGLLPGNINGIGLLGLSQQWLIKFGISSNLYFWLISVSLTFLLLVNIFFIARKIKDVYLNKLLVCALLFPLIMALTSHDSYYVYKISYIFQFVIIGYLVARVLELVRSSKLKFKKTNFVLNLPFQGLIILLVISNTLWNGVTSYQVIVNNSHWTSISKSIGDLGSRKISNSVLETDSYLLNNIASFVTQDLRPLTPESLAAPLTALTLMPENGTYTAQLVTIPDNSVWLTGDGISSSEADPRGKFRWVYGIRTKPKSLISDYNSVKILRLNSTSAKVHETLCVSLPDWDLKKSGTLKVIGQDNKTVVEFAFSKEITCKSFDIPKNVSLLTLQTNLLGSAPSLFDTRSIVFRIWDLGSKHQIYRTLG